jgi:hypothetical protein
MGSLFKAKATSVQTSAPAVDNPVQEPEDPVLGAKAQETSEEKAKKGKKGLKIKLDSDTSSGVGANYV